MRAEIYLQQERWTEAYHGLVTNAPDFLESLSERFNEDTTDYLHKLGRSAEGTGDWGAARRYYADANFAPTPHAEARAGLADYNAAAKTHRQELREINKTYSD